MAADGFRGELRGSVLTVRYSVAVCQRIALVLLDSQDGFSFVLSLGGLLDIEGLGLLRRFDFDGPTEEELVSLFHRSFPGPVVGERDALQLFVRELLAIS